MGASLSSNVYQYKVDGHLEDIQNCMAITDDIITYGWMEWTMTKWSERWWTKLGLWECNLIPQMPILSNPSKIFWTNANKTGCSA